MYGARGGRSASAEIQAGWISHGGWARDLLAEWLTEHAGLSPPPAAYSRLLRPSIQLSKLDRQIGQSAFAGGFDLRGSYSLDWDTFDPNHAPSVDPIARVW